MDQTTPSLQEIQDKIRAAATAAGINPDTALRIANAESVFSNTAKNTRSSARGLFQVIDQTWKDLGGDPKLRNDLDENIRIGIKAISNNRDAFLKKYGTEPDTKQLYGMHFLGPSQAIRVFNSAEDAAIKNIVPKKVIKANPFLDKMSVADFINFTQTKMDKKGTVTPSATAIAKTETAPVPMPQAPKETMQQAPTKPATPRAAPMNRDMLAELGPSYQAALGAISLADSAEDDDDELLAERYAERFGDQGNEVVPSTLGDIQLSYASPFEEPAPVQMAAGGEVGVQKMAFGGLPYKPSALIPSAVKNQVGQAQADLDAYNQQVGSYNAQMEDYKRRVDEYNTKANAYNEQRGQYLSSYVGGENPTVYVSSRGQYRPVIGSGSMFATNTPNIRAVSYGNIPGLDKVPGYMIRQGEYRNLEKPTEPGNAPGGEPTAPVQPNVGATQASVEAAKAKQRRLQLTYDVMEDPERFNLSMPALFAEGGVADRANQPITTPDGYEITPSFADRMGANVSDFVVNVGTKAASLFPVDETKMSAAHRLYLDTFGIKENRAPVTKDYFNQEEMAALTDLVSRKGGKKGSITYNDYKELMGDRPVKSYPLTSGRLDPYVSISKSLGQFNYEYDPKTGNYKILDQYDFNPKPIRGGISSDSNFIGDYIGEERASLMDKLRIYAGRKLPPGTGRQVDLSVPAPRKRAEGSPVYGEIPDSGGITPDTRAALTNYEDFKNFSPREAFNMFMGIGREANSNAESLVRGSLAAVPGTFGDIGQEFDIRGLRNLPTTEQLLKKYPQRMTQPTAETATYENIGQYVPPPVSPSFVKSTAQTMMNAFKKAAPTGSITGPTSDQLRQLVRSIYDSNSRNSASNVVQAAPQAAKAVEAAAPVGRSADQLFVGRVDEFLANQKNPVTKEQLIGQLKGKFRDYEIARVEEALADLPATSKLQPADLLARVKSKYPVENFRTSIIEPKPGVVYSNVDNVYGGDIGVINLSLPVADVARKASDDAMLTLNSLNNFGKGRFNPPQIAQITNYLKEKGLSSNYKELLNSLKVVENSPEIKKLTTAKETLLDVGRAVMYPSLHAKEAEVFAKLKKQYPNKSVGELLPLRDMEMARIGLKQLTDLASDPQFKTLQPIASALKRGIDSGQEVRTSDIIGKINVEVSLLDEQFKPAIDTLVSGAAKDEYTKLGKELQKKRIYEGQHNSITAKENPIAFSRFVDKEAVIPGMGKTKTMHIIELQSDLFDDIIKKGPKAGSKEKDLAEVADLDKKAFQIEHSGPFQKEAVDKLKTISRKFYPSPAEKSEAYKEILGRYPDLKTQLIDYMKMSDRSEKLKARAEIGNYNMDEAFAGMEKSPQVLQQLMIKNSIGAAMQRGVNAITFPGKESQQSQLYEKLGPNLKQVVKDLGKGFEIRSIELYDDFGQPYMHQGLVWSKEAAARLLKEGIRFNQGGAVDKNNLDYAKYI